MNEISNWVAKTDVKVKAMSIEKTQEFGVDLMYAIVSILAEYKCNLEVCSRILENSYLLAEELATVSVFVE